MIISLLFMLAFMMASFVSRLRQFVLIGTQIIDCEIGCFTFMFSLAFRKNLRRNVSLPIQGL